MNEREIGRSDNTLEEDIFPPLVDIEESKDDIIVWADLPGVHEDDLRITLDKSVLSIEANVSPDERPTYRLAHREYKVAVFRRAFTISDAVDQARIRAALKDGVLRLVIPKSDAVKPRTIIVKKG